MPQKIRHLVVPVLILGFVCGAGVFAQGQRSGQAQGGRGGRGGGAAGPVGDFFRYDPSAPRGAAVPGGPPAVTHHQITVHGQAISYTATATFMPIQNATTGAIMGHLFYVYYAKDGVTDAATRPVTFCFNGGPGSGTIWLHMGAFGPKKIALEPSGMSPAPPYHDEDNPNTLLDVSDLVFIDAMGTGWSRPASPADGAYFWGVDNDIAAFGEFVRSFLNRYDRWNSPRFLAGESYGTTRAAGLSGYLTDHDIPVQGVFLLSTIIDTRSRAGDLASVNILPTEIMTAWYYKKVAPDLQKLSADQMSAQALDFAGHEYQQALYDGARMTAAQRQKVLEDLHRYTGLSVAFLDQNDLRISLGKFSTELLRDRHMMTSRLDSRFPGYLPDGGAQSTPFDFSDANIENSFLTVLENYMRHDLNFKDDDIYYVLGGGIGPWSGSYDTVTNLEDALARNPRMHVFFAMGYYDFATVYGAVEWTIAQMQVSPEVRAHNIMTAHYQAGHMVYIDAAAAAKMHADLVRFYQTTLAQK
jgi:carboxypeptidase C (cathepsin A)